ncbi:MAG: heavy metal-responsive transcriptional regulator [Acidimicrobiia bacterium]
MRIGQLARAVGVDTPTIRFYESVGLLPEPARRPSGYRDYDESDIERLRFVRQARSLDLPLDDIREILALREEGEAPCPYVREVIAREAAAIEDRIAQLVTLRAELLRLHQVAPELPDNPPGEKRVCHILEHADLKSGDG